MYFNLDENETGAMVFRCHILWWGFSIQQVLEKLVSFPASHPIIVSPRTSAQPFLAFCVRALEHCCSWHSWDCWTDRVSSHLVGAWYSLLHGTGYRQRSGAGLINTVQGHVWQVVVIAVTLDLPWRQAVVVCVCCEDMTQMQNSVAYACFVLILLKSHTSLFR